MLSGFYDAPAVICLFGPNARTFVFGREDAAILIDYLCLISSAYALGGYMVGELVNEFQTPYGQELLKR